MRKRSCVLAPVDKAASSLSNSPYSFPALVFAMSNDKEATRFLNSLAQESRALLESCDGHVLSEFISDYCCRDDPIDNDGEFRV